MNKPLAFDLTKEDWAQFAQDQAAPPFVANQIFHWLYKKKIYDPSLFTNLSQELRGTLASSFSFALPSVVSHLISKDSTEKFLLTTDRGELYEMVLMPYPNRVTLCISTQVGCRIGCTFCQTGKLGLTKNLSKGEILSQILLASTRYPITNVVFMGMGEPLDNFDEVVGSLRMMTDPSGLQLSRKKVTISTSGITPRIDQLGKEFPCPLALSLHNADNEKRSKLMPINRTYELESLKAALLRYPKQMPLTIEYVLIEGENDNPDDAKKLARFLHGLRAKVNLIPINHFPGNPMKASSKERINAFQRTLTERNIPAPVRYSRGQDISAGCGQLAAKKQEEINQDPRLLASERRKKNRFALSFSRC